MTNKALIIIDVQNGMFQKGFTVYNGEKLLDRLSGLSDKARLAKRPVFYVQHNEAAGEPLEHGTHGWEIHPQIAPRENDVIIQKNTPDSFFETSLDQELRDRNITNVYLAGIQSEICVDTTCRRAFSMGYEVTLISDTHSTWDTKELTAQQIINHHNGLLRWFAEVQPSSEINFSD
ncbi:cysteine hydrolase family protein [Virgibacillus kekensis]|uniref:Cysteine hydrolase family protein n=1 Tax=Virgibacillus kekensis TaxID=202261 RepID=A0ABV9DMX8_9BACI